jgi:hypothetical protein
VFIVMDNESVSVNGSRCLISYVNVVVLLIITIKDELFAAFVSLRIIVYLAILGVNIPCRIADSYRPSMLMLSESNLCVPMVPIHISSPRVFVNSSCRVLCLVVTISQVHGNSDECHQVYYNAVLNESIIVPG